MQTKLKVLGFFILLLWSFVLIQSFFPIIKSNPVKGAFSPAKDTTLTWQNWWEGCYQKKKNAYWNDHVGFHSDFVRINNQIDFSLFGKVHAKSVIVGKNWFLYEKGYVDALAGRDFRGSVEMNRKIANLSKLRDSLAKQNIPVLVILAPNKARLYPEYLPDSLKIPAADSSNYNICLNSLKKYNIPHIDVSAWFLKLKPTSHYPLAAQYGIHWSKYGVALVADSLTSVLNKMGLYTPKIRYKIKYEKNANILTSSSDYDIGLGLNLITPLPFDSIPYPEFEYIDDKTQTKISPIFLSDSFFWMFMYQDIANALFADKWEFWNYGHEVWKGKDLIKSIDIQTAKSELYHHSALVIIVSEVNIAQFGYGLLD